MANLIVILPVADNSKSCAARRSSIERNVDHGTPAKEQRDSFLIELVERYASPPQPSTQISHEPDLVTRRRLAVALFGEQSSKIVQVRFQWSGA